MKYFIKELRNSTGLSQRAFASLYNIPVSTLCKWEQGKSSPPPYITELIAKTLPSTDKSLIKIKSGTDTYFYYDKNKHTISDSLGNTIITNENLEEINKKNLPVYLEDLFNDFYRIQEKFNRDCRFDKKENIVWT